MMHVAYPRMKNATDRQTHMVGSIRRSSLTPKREEYLIMYLKGSGTVLIYGIILASALG
jgi:hypothetical protein